jgi:hypothetical protein
LEVNDGKTLTRKEFVKVYGLSAMGISPKWIKVPRDITTEEVSKVFGPIQNENGHSYVFSEDLVLITKVERLYMLVNQKHVIPTTRLIYLGFAKGVVMEMTGDKMN